MLLLRYRALSLLKDEYEPLIGLIRKAASVEDGDTPDSAAYRITLSTLHGGKRMTPA